MQIDTSSKAVRRQIADEFKERKVPQGIYAIRCTATGDVWVGSSTNLNAVQNSQWFSASRRVASLGISPAGVDASYRASLCI